MKGLISLSSSVCIFLYTTERLPFHLSLSCIGEGNGNPFQCSCLENPRDGGAWWASVYGVAQSRTWLKQLSSSSSIYRKALNSLTWEVQSPLTNSNLLMSQLLVGKILKKVVTKLLGILAPPLPLGSSPLEWSERLSPRLEVLCCCCSCSVTKLCLTLCDPVLSACEAPLSSTIPRVSPKSCPLSRWCYLTIIVCCPLTAPAK